MVCQFRIPVSCGRNGARFGLCTCGLPTRGQFSNHLYPCSRSDMVDGGLHVDGHRRIYRDSLATAYFGYGRVSHGTHRRGVHLYCPYHWCYLGQTDVGSLVGVGCASHL
ncbi:Uncharacterised protein [Vibrio cholerae]|nr:Uncharacterised protein [Vibrio cholerae]